ncbi:MAG: cation transporter, partial [Gemmatimonadota bacterium]
MFASRAPAPPDREGRDAAGKGGPAGAASPGSACRVDLRIQGMDCPDCARRIQEHLAGVEGVREAVGNPVSRRLRVDFDPD